MSSLSEALKTDTRFHPGIIGVILVMSLLGIAALVSYMEGYRYLDAFYACFITFSLVGFGDINIYVSILLKLLYPCKSKTKSNMKQKLKVFEGLLNLLIHTF